ncbi:STM3941 family protein [Formosa sp. A9]|uniref:STM3941 family protein n=1 Tax=Formosa sp. A9 TaxID=3442641 RepID=UPI003EC072F7
MNDEIILPVSKSKIMLLFVGALIFVAGGIQFVYAPQIFANSKYRPKSPELIEIIGITAVLFFGVCAIFGLKKLFDKKTGLKINADGITDYLSATSIGLIKWSDIVGIGTAQVHSQKFVIVEVSNPEYYINLNKSRIGKMAMQSNYNSLGSPISISTISLKITFTDLKELIETHYEKYAPQDCITTITANSSTPESSQNC